MTHTCIVKPADIYMERPIIEPGYKVIDFRPPKKGEISISNWSHRLYVADVDFNEYIPRLILERVKAEPEAADWWE